MALGPWFSLRVQGHRTFRVLQVIAALLVHIGCMLKPLLYMGNKAIWMCMAIWHGAKDIKGLWNGDLWPQGHGLPCMISSTLWT